MAAQKQHYVPRLLLNGFLSRYVEHAKKQQVHVMDLQMKKEYRTSIDNIMSERRYNDYFLEGGDLVTIENATSKIENYISPLLLRLRNEKKLTRTDEETSDLAFLMAFQFIRTKKIRELPRRVIKQIRDHTVKLGFNPDDIKELKYHSEEEEKLLHLRHQMNDLDKYTKIIANKVFFLMSTSTNNSFYISDHPVVLHNDEPKTFYTGNLGLAVPYIQIFMPISADIMLCAFDKAVIEQIKSMHLSGLRDLERHAFSKVIKGEIDAITMKKIVEKYKMDSPSNYYINRIESGEPIQLSDKQVEIYNSLQVFQSNRFIIDPNGKFDVAKDILKNHPKLRFD